LSGSINEFIDLFVESPGNFLYFLSVIAISQATLLMALGQRLRQPEDRAAKRYTITAGGVVVGWALLMIGALFTLLFNEEARVILPPLERAVVVFTILITTWGFLTADDHRWGRVPNLILLLLLAIVTVGYVITGSLWLDRASTEEFNVSSLGVTWAFLPVVMSLAGMTLMIAYFRVVVDAPLKLLFFVVLFAGHLGTLIQIGQGDLVGDYAGLSRLAFLVALPILPAVVYRMVIGNLEIEVLTQSGIQRALQTGPQPLQQVVSPLADAPQQAPPAPHTKSSDIPDMDEVGRQRESAQFMRALGLILEDAAPANIPQRIITASMEVLKADVGALLTLKDANYADIMAAYDRVRERRISGLAINLNDQPTLVNAIERQLQRPLYPDRNVEELDDLYTRLDIDQVGPAYFQPLTHNKELIAVLLVASPYAKRELRENERELLKGLALISGSLLALSKAAHEARVQAEERAIQAMIQGGLPGAGDEEDASTELHAELEASREQITQLTSEITRLKLELDEERQRFAEALENTDEGKSVSQRIVSLTVEQKQLREDRDRLAARLQEVETMLAGATSTDNEVMFARLVEVLRREKDELEIQRNQMEAELRELRGNKAIPQVVQDMLDRMSHEKAQLDAERRQLMAQIDDIQAQLTALGIEDGPAGVSRFIEQLYQDRAELEMQLDTVRQERDALLNERQRLGANRDDKDQRKQLDALQLELKHLAGDREVLTKRLRQLQAEHNELRKRVETLKQQRARFFAESIGYQDELTESHEAERRLRQEIERLSNERSEIIKERDRLLAENKALETERDQYLARVEGDRDRLKQLGVDGVGALTKMIEELTEQRNQLEEQLHEAQTNLAAMENQLDMIEVQSRGQVTEGYQSSDPETIMTMVEDLRTPMMSIVSYTDLLLSESAGILMEMQREFLNRINANVNELTAMVNDLIHVTALDTGNFELRADSVDVIGIIEDTITSTSHQFREKELTLHINLDDDVPPVTGDADAIEQIIGQLLTNAYLVSPPGGTITVVANRNRPSPPNGKDRKPIDGLFVSIEDGGGGIAPEDAERIFGRKYKANNPLIRGLGDTGVGLAIAKALVTAHGGELWFETQEDVGTVFCFVLPFRTTLEAQE